MPERSGGVVRGAQRDDALAFFRARNLNARAEDLQAIKDQITGGVSVLTAATADLAADVRLVAEVLDEAYEILREPHRRERYRRAIEAGPP